MTKSDFSGFWVEKERKGNAIVNIGNVWRKGLLLGILLLLVLIGSAQAENFTVRVEKDIIGFDENQITVETDQTGLLTLTLSDNYGTYRTITREAKRGVTTFMWDGLGENEERLPSGSYTLHALLVTARGNQETQINVTVGKAKQALLFALRSSDTLYLDTDDWFCEAKPVRTGAVVMDIYAADELNTKLDTLKKTFGSTTKVSWNGRVKGKKVAEGDSPAALLRGEQPGVCARCACDGEGKRAPRRSGGRNGQHHADVGHGRRGNVGHDDEAERSWWTLRRSAIRRCMTSRRRMARHLGTLHGQSQGVEVLKVEGGWAYIGAWQHESGGYIEGWVPMKRLKTVTPNSDFGLVVDKQTQRMKVFYRGKCITTLTISTRAGGQESADSRDGGGRVHHRRTRQRLRGQRLSLRVRHPLRRRQPHPPAGLQGAAHEEGLLRPRTGAGAEGLARVRPHRARWMQPGSTSTTYGHTCPTARVCSSSMTRKIVRCKPPPSAIRCRRM